MDGELSYVVAVPDTPEAALTVQVCSCCCCELKLRLVRVNETCQVYVPQEMLTADKNSGRRDSHDVHLKNIRNISERLPARS